LIKIGDFPFSPLFGKIDRQRVMTETPAKISSAFLETPVGVLKIEASQDKIISVLFSMEKGRNGRQPEVLKDCLKQLKEYFYHGRKSFSLPLELAGTPWQQQVWQEILNIPFGKISSYSELAEKLGGKQLARSVASACAHNKLLFIIPCHRVIGIKGDAAGYRGGLKHKRWLLDFEKTKE
jgi:methylated-DNA-[protein]-cysteine S-methyltransferase